MDDREWMYTGRSSQRALTDEWIELTDEWIEKTDAFLELAFAKVKGARATWCPCTRCQNKRRQTKVVMGKHLFKNGFMADYTRWTYHGEADHMRDEVVRQQNEDYDANAGVGDMLNDYHEAQFDEVVIRVGGGKKHGRYWIDDSALDTATTPTLSQIQARSTSSSPAIRLRPDTTQSRMEALQAHEEEMMMREETEARMWEQMKAKMEARMEANRQRMQADLQRMQAERQRLQAEQEAERQRMEQMFQYLQSLSEKMGQPMPPMLFPAPPPPTTTPAPPPTTTPNESTASNDEPHDEDLSSSWLQWPPQ